jgi:hypothetical protein
MSPGRQLGLLWGAVAASLVALSPLAARIAPALPACPFKSLTGLPCLTCGATRAALALGRFDFPAAFAVSPLAAAAWIALIAGGLAAGIASLARLEVPEPPRDLPRALRWAILAAVLANWAYLIWTGA